MSYTKILPSDLVNKGVIGLPDTPGLDTTQMQQKFDEIALDVIIPHYNDLIDELEETILPATGDMKKSVYDTDNDGKVDAAEDADTVNSHTVESDVPADAVFTDTTYTAGTNITIDENNEISATDTTYTAGTNVSISDQNVISATDTTYESKSAASGGTDVSLVTTGEKYTWNNKADTSAIPTKTSVLINDSGFITNTVDNLTNYYAKSGTYSKAEVDALISAATSGGFIVVQTLPTQDINPKAIYLVPKTTAEANDVYDEYIYVSNNWELIGSTDIDLSDYVTTSDLTTALANYMEKDGGNHASRVDLYSMAVGTGLLISGSNTKLVVGKYNSDTVDSNAIFQVGNGSGLNERSNAFEVYADGGISCSGRSAKMLLAKVNYDYGFYDVSNHFHRFGSGDVSNAIKSVKVGSTTITASGESTLELKAGSNVTLSADTSDNSVTINASGGGQSTGDMLSSDYDSDFTVKTAGGIKTYVTTGLATKTNETSSFTEASTRTNIASGDTVSTIFGKIKKFFSDLKTVAFTGAYSDLTGRPIIPDITGKADKAPITVGMEGNFGGVDQDGNLTNSGYKASDFKAASAHDAWTDVTSKPFNTVGDGLSVVNNALKVTNPVTITSGVSKVVGDTSVTFSNAAILTTSIVELFCENTSGTPIPYTSASISTGSATFNFAALTEATTFKARITN